LIASDTGRPLTWSWKSDFDGFSGGVATITNNQQVDLGSGSGGVTITEIFGLPQASPNVTCAASPNSLWPPDNKSIGVIIFGSVIAGTQPLISNISSFSVTDTEKLVQPQGDIILEPNGHYSFLAPLAASRNGESQNGRQYTIRVTVQDAIGNVGSCSTIVTVPHDQKP
jgi:hypothetical protein